MTEIKSSKAGGPTAAKRQGGNKILGPLPPEMSMICARPRPPPISCRGCSETPMRLITCDGRTQNLRAWAREIGIGWCALQQRLAKGWPVEQALSAGKRELYKGKPALAPLARKAGVSARGPSTEGRSAIQWRRCCSQVSYRIRPSARSHSTARPRA